MRKFRMHYYNVDITVTVYGQFVRFHTIEGSVIT